MRLLWGLTLCSVMVVSILLVIPKLRERTVLTPSSPKDQSSNEATRKPDPEPRTGRAKTGSGTLYRWRDADGVVHIESTPPLDGTEFESITFEFEQAPRAPSPTTTSGGTRASGKSSESSTESSPLNVYAPEGMVELMERIDETANLLEERRKVMDQLEKDL